MSMTEAPYSVSFTRGKPALITVRAESAQEWVERLTQASESGALTHIVQIQDSLNGVQGATQAASSVPATDTSQQLPSSYTDVACKTCKAPTTFVKDGTSAKSGKPYKMYACTADQLHDKTFTEA